MQVTHVIRRGDRHSILHHLDGGRTVVLTDCTGHVVDRFDCRGRLVGTQRLAADRSHADLVAQVAERLRYSG